MKATNKNRETFNQYCKEHIINNIEDYNGETVYASEFADKLCEKMNCDGTCTYSTYEANEYLKEWWYDCSEYWEYEKSNFGEVYHNPFENPEAYMVCMVIQGVKSLISQCSIIDENWDNEIEITEEVIKTILEEIEDFEVSM